MRHMIKYIIVIAIIYHASTHSLALLQLTTQLNTMTTGTQSLKALPPHNFKSWFNAHAYLNYDDKYEMQQRSSKERLKEAGPTCRQITLEQLTAILEATMRMQHEQFKRTAAPSSQQAQYYYLQKLIIPDNSTIHFFGDLHANISSLVICLAKLHQQGVFNEKFEVQDIKSSPQFIFFGGDFTDRGEFGAEVLQTICKLKLNNPERVFLIRGNHEKVSINESYGFIEELSQKFPLMPATTKDIKVMLRAFYASLPVAIFLGIQNKLDTNYLLLCHGGLDFYDPTTIFTQKTVTLGKNKNTQLASTYIIFDRKKFIKELPSSRYKIDNKKLTAENIDQYEPAKKSCGFMWNDFNAGGMIPKKDQPGRSFKSLAEFYQFLTSSLFIDSRGFMFGSTLGNDILDKMNKKNHYIIGVLRAHQHNASMPQLLSAQFSREHNYPLSNSSNQSLYKIPRQSGFKYHIFTTVSTSAFTPSPSFIKINMAADPRAWSISNYYLEEFQKRMNNNKVEYLSQLSGGKGWTRKSDPVTEWQNSFDGNSEQLIKEQKLPKKKVPA